MREFLRKPRNAEPVPVILSPQPGSTVSGEALRLSWKSLSQSRNYQVRIVKSDGDLIWEGETEKSALQVPANVALKDGSYFVWITAYLQDGRIAKSAPVRFLIKR